MTLLLESLKQDKYVSLIEKLRIGSVVCAASFGWKERRDSSTERNLNGSAL
jgi:hypothetical protein